MGLEKIIYLGNLDAKRDWGHAKDYVRMMWMILQHDKPEDWVIATGKTVSVRDFVIMSFKCIDVEIEFKGSGINEKGYVVSSTNSKYKLSIGRQVVAIDKNYFRPTEVDMLVGDASKANKKLGWKPMYNIENLVEEMMSSDLKLTQKDFFK